MSHEFLTFSSLLNVKNDGKEKIMLKVSLIDRTAWFTRLFSKEEMHLSHFVVSSTTSGGSIQNVDWVLSRKNLTKI